MEEEVWRRRVRRETLKVTSSGPNVLCVCLMYICILIKLQLNVNIAKLRCTKNFIVGKVVGIPLLIPTWVEYLTCLTAATAQRTHRQRLGWPQTADLLTYIAKVSRQCPTECPKPRCPRREKGAWPFWEYSLFFRSARVKMCHRTPPRLSLHSPQSQQNLWSFWPYLRANGIGCTNMFVLYAL